jgi:hypothetical protein
VVEKSSFFDTNPPKSHLIIHEQLTNTGLMALRALMAQGFFLQNVLNDGHGFSR